MTLELEWGLGPRSPDCHEVGVDCAALQLTASPGDEVFAELKARWPWRPLPNCPGRFVFSSGPTNLPPAALVPRDVDVSEHLVVTAKDPVVVAMFADGGLISYRKPDGTYLHTLNSREGLERKLQQLGLDVSR